MQWIEPIKEQLNRLEKRFEQLSSVEATACASSVATSNQRSLSDCHEDQQVDDDTGEREDTPENTG